jgi:hypothetical protein
MIPANAIFKLLDTIPVSVERSHKFLQSNSNKAFFNKKLSISVLVENLEQ